MPSTGNARERPLKVCFVSAAVTSVFDPDLSPTHGGAEVQTVRLAELLSKKKGFEVHFVVTDRTEAPPVVPEGMSVHGVPKTMRRRIPVVAQVVDLATWMARLHSTGCDVFFQSQAGGVTGRLALYCALARRAFAFRVANDADIDGSILDHDSMNKRLYLWGLKRADVVFVQTREQAEAFGRQHGIDTVLLPKSFFVGEKTREHDKRYVLWLGSALPRKRPDVFVDLARSLPQFDFRMVIPRRDDATHSAVTKMARSVGNLEVLEGLPLSRVRDAFEGALAYVLTSEWEGFSDAIVQAAAAGAPVLSLHVDPDGVLSRGAFGLCAEGDVDRLRADLEEVLGNDALRLAMGERGRTWAGEINDPSRTSAGLADALREAHASRLRGHRRRDSFVKR